MLVACAQLCFIYSSIYFQSLHHHLFIITFFVILLFCLFLEVAFF